MATNFTYVGKPVGLMKVVNLVFGLVSLGCVAAVFDNDEIRERYFLGAVATCFAVSLGYLLFYFAWDQLELSLINKTVDAIYHFVGAMLLIVGASLFLQHIVTFNQEICDDIPSVLDKNPELCGGKYHTKISAGAFGLINGVFYLLTLALRLLDPTDDDDDMQPQFGAAPARRPVSASK